MAMAQTNGNGERDLLASIGPRSLFFGACTALFAPPLQAPPPHPTISVTAAVPPVGSAQFTGARLAFGAPPLNVALPRKPMFVDSPVPPAGAGLVSHQHPSSFPALSAPPRRGTWVTPNWTPQPIPSLVFTQSKPFILDQRPAKTIVARPEFRPQEFASLHLAMPVQMVPPLAPPRPRMINVPQQLPQFLPSTVFWRSEAIPTTFALVPAVPAIPQVTTPATGYPATPGDFPLFLQWQDEGVDLGLPDVRVVNFVGDPAVIKATRGVGENSHVITLALVPPVSAVPGWNTTNEVGAWAFTNSDFTGETTIEVRAGGTDIYLLHFDGDFTDTAGLLNPWGVLDSGAIDVVTTQFGSGSLSRVGNGTHASIRTTANTLPLVSQFCIDAWAYTTHSDSSLIFDLGEISNGSDTVQLYWDAAASQLKLVMVAGASATAFGATAVLPTGQWNHFRGTYDGLKLRIFLNGILDGQANLVAASLPAGSSYAMTLDCGSHTGTKDRFLDECRFVIGAFISTADFTPPAVPFVIGQ